MITFCSLDFDVHGDGISVFVSFSLSSRRWSHRQLLVRSANLNWWVAGVGIPALFLSFISRHSRSWSLNLFKELTIESKPLGFDLLARVTSTLRGSNRFSNTIDVSPSLRCIAQLDSFRKPSEIMLMKMTISFFGFFRWPGISLQAIAMLSLSAPGFEDPTRFLSLVFNGIDEERHYVVGTFRWPWLRTQPITISWRERHWAVGIVLTTPPVCSIVTELNRCSPISQLQFLGLFTLLEYAFGSSQHCQ